MKSAIFGPIWTQFRSKQLKIWPGSHFAVNLIKSIQSSQINKKWLPGQILRSLDLNWVQIGPKMANFWLFWFKSDQKWQNWKVSAFSKAKNLNNFCNIFEVPEDWKFQIFQTLRKNDVKLELLKLGKTRSHSNSDSNIRVQVRNAGP